MHRFITFGIFLYSLLICVTTNAANLDQAEQRWIDAHPVVHFSIHKKYAPYLESSEQGESNGIFYTFLQKLGDHTQQEFRPIWRNSDAEGFSQLANGEVDFMIDPPSINSELHSFGQLSEALFWGHDAVVTKSRKDAQANTEKASVKYAYFDRGYENVPVAAHPEAYFSSNIDGLVYNLIRSDVDALVLPVRLAQQLIKKLEHPLQIDHLYSREPFAYRWLISNDDAPLHRVLNHFLNNLDPIESGQSFGIELSKSETKRAPGNKAPWLFSLALLLSGISLIWVMHKKQRRQEQAAADLLSSKEIAEKANAAKTSFLATMSHEIRTPMNAILGVQELLLNSQRFPLHEKLLLKSAHTSAESLLGILNQVLDLSKIEAGKLTLNLEPCCLNALINDIHSAFSAVASKQNLTLHTSKDPRIAEVLMIDALRLRQILQNLISNAIKFTERGEVYFSISILADDHAGQLIEFRVIDTGIGMGADEIELALQAFEQIPGKRDQENGTGLGLTITNHLVTSMNSQLYIDSAPGLGSNIHFCVAFPRTSIAASRSVFSENSVGSAKKLLPQKSNPTKNTLSALVVEDHAASRQIISLQLQALGIQTSVCADATTALGMINENQFDLLITDQSIPGMQGSELTKQIRALGHTELIIIGVTADIYALDSRHQFLSAGMNGVLIKPISLMSLENELSRYFKSIEIKDTSSTPCTSKQEYSFDAFSNLLKDKPDQILVILDEIKRVHIETIASLNQGSIDETSLESMIHKIKGGAQLLNAKKFIEALNSLNAEVLPSRIGAFRRLLEEQNLLIEQYRENYQNLLK
jgi:two-component system sensor histidine kinase EvgS